MPSVLFRPKEASKSGLEAVVVPPVEICGQKWRVRLNRSQGAALAPALLVLPCPGARDGPCRLQGLLRGCSERPRHKQGTATGGSPAHVVQGSGGCLRALQADKETSLITKYGRSLIRVCLSCAMWGTGLHVCTSLRWLWWAGSGSTVHVPAPRRKGKRQLSAGATE